MQTVFLTTNIEMINIPIIVWAVYIGIAIGLVMTYYNKVVLGKAVRSIIEKKAFSEDGALSAEELGFQKNPFVLHSIRRGVLGRFILTVEKESEPIRYYIKEEDSIRAELRYSNKGTDLYVMIVALVIFLLLAFVAARYLPVILEAAGDLMS